MGLAASVPIQTVGLLHVTHSGKRGYTVHAASSHRQGAALGLDGQRDGAQRRQQARRRQEVLRQRRVAIPDLLELTVVSSRHRYSGSLAGSTKADTKAFSILASHCFAAFARRCGRPF